ncbi:hypothetical protein [Haliangium ochraceum]|uniref:SMODS and SLOG-associating 2TM effector domain-containing protein n=1 Tax=Haliangium ochraceum (strain DSM 14365 / JCM 11303 / SMP-2) TaxID=502025 RepID=D0LT58_HALO1|nr:hypothetical protein [Haliangium ochraceum]ACY19194.1 hypothetical protein Hoch_6730 [Haliangium ochraceum DSM 14365]
MSAHRPLYSFEHASGGSVRKRESARQELPAFRKRLGLPEKTSVEVDEALLLFIVEVHLNIAWYADRLRREDRMRRFYTIVSAVLFMAVPALVWFLSGGFDVFASDDGGEALASSAHSTAAEITAVITGLLAVHRALSAWLDKRQIHGHFWRASADLKELLYSFEESWSGRAALAAASTEDGLAAATAPLTAEGELSTEFHEALAGEIARARQIVRKEREGFYELYKSTAFDVVQRLGDTFTQAQTMTRQFSAPQLNERLDREQEESEKRRRKLTLSAEIVGFERLIAEDRAALAQAEDAAERARLEQNIAQTQRTIDQSRQDLVKIEAALKALSAL